MKKGILLCISALCMVLFASCSSRSNLYEHTDYFIDKLSTTYQSYGLQGLSEKKTTKNSKYSVTPMGRLIIVKIEDYVPDKEYESLCKDLERHYKKDSRVNRVYINQGGTVVIDCRNQLLSRRRL